MIRRIARRSRLRALAARRSVSLDPGWVRRAWVNLGRSAPAAHGFSSSAGAGGGDGDDQSSSLAVHEELPARVRTSAQQPSDGRSAGLMGHMDDPIMIKGGAPKPASTDPRGDGGANLHLRKDNIIAPAIPSVGDMLTMLSEQVVMTDIPVPKTALSATNVTGHSPECLEVNNVLFHSSVLLLQHTTLLWDAQTMDDITEESFAWLQVFKPRPDVLLIGTGAHTQWLSPKLEAYLNDELHVSHECSSTFSALSTFNFLNKEDRRVACMALRVPADQFDDHINPDRKDVWATQGERRSQRRVSLGLEKPAPLPANEPVNGPTGMPHRVGGLMDGAEPGSAVRDRSLSRRGRGGYGIGGPLGDALPHPVAPFPGRERDEDFNYREGTGKEVWFRRRRRGRNTPQDNKPDDEPQER